MNLFVIARASARVQPEGKARGNLGGLLAAYQITPPTRLLRIPTSSEWSRNDNSDTVS